MPSFLVYVSVMFLCVFLNVFLSILIFNVAARVQNEC